MSNNKDSDEDCLFLNIWSRTTQEKNPVMVYIHGGGYAGGAGSQDFYHGHHLAYHQSVVVVTINYRLGAFGYIHFHNLPESQGRFDSNCGLRDQVASLRWIKENIEAFGGNPNNVTIFGESAGGNAVTTLMAVPSAKGLFHRVISQSSPAFAIMNKKWSVFAATEFVQNYLKINNLLDVLSMDWKQIIDALKTYCDDMTIKLPGMMALCPCIDHDFLPVNPVDAVRNGSCPGVPLLIGFTKDEATLFSRLASITGKNVLVCTTPQVDKFFENNPHLDKEKFMSCYRSIHASEYLNRFGADMAFNIPAIQFAEAHSAHAPVYMYRYDFVSIVQRMTYLGAAHMMEVPFIFGTVYVGLFKYMYYLSNANNVSALLNRMQGAWACFARSGDPGVEDWMRYTTDNRCTKIFNNNDQVEYDVQEKERGLWDGVSFYQKE
ncbi:carboxylesterase [Acrasis kona]|uniref:Carboxylic ester hydrolase n=1 Tax=Acrasis kona TaxID=1008807 RepID=A0AAW2ZHN5_9EUKA